ncbi:MAG: LON peptidase substrate-binding domain-containing protein, partial [bacterium]
MDIDPLPLFPLPIVLLPGELVPLHIFEERYREMIDLCREENIPFGIVLAEGGGHRRIGCAARIAEVTEEFPDG